MLRALCAELRSRATLLHCTAFLTVLGICVLISAVPLPAVDDAGPLGSPREPRLAYGYLYFPVIAAPIAVSWLESRFAWAVPQGSIGARVVETVAAATAGLVVTVGAGAVGMYAFADAGLIVAVTNALWVSAVAGLMRLRWEPAWVSVTVIAYGSLGLFLPSMPFLLISRDAGLTELSAALAVAVLVLAVTWRVGTPRRE